MSSSSIWAFLRTSCKKNEVANALKGDNQPQKRLCHNMEHAYSQCEACQMEEKA